MYKSHSIFIPSLPKQGMALDTLAPNIPQWLLITVILWEVLWKGLSMWKASHKEHKIWFVALLLLNTMGILQILYYYWFSDISSKTKKRTKKVSSKRKKTKKKK
tara:strand:+ start:2232 stop:2543 length:312 start_codon:yes stop_codon:yes gene_type:complete